MKLGDFGGSFRRLSKRNLLQETKQNEKQQPQNNNNSGENTTEKEDISLSSPSLSTHLTDQTLESSDSSSPVHVFPFRSSRSILKKNSNHGNSNMSSSRKQLIKALEAVKAEEEKEKRGNYPADPPGASFSVDEDDNVDNSEGSSTSSVRFDLEMTEFFPNGRDLTSMREWNRCWYNDKALKAFKTDASKTADKVLVGKGAGWRPRGSLIKRHAAEQLRQVLMQVFEECRSIKTEEDMEEAFQQVLNREGNKDLRSNLCELYQQSDELVGLEVFLLSGLRGDASYLCRRVLTFVDEKVKEGKHTRKSFLYARTSQTISRASRLYVRELAMAHAAALKAAS